MVPRPVLDPRLDSPLYRQLYSQLRQYIESGQLQDGDRLPATREMAGLLGLNRTTVSAAYELLETEGFIKGWVGRGSFVTVPAAASPVRMVWDRLLTRPEDSAPSAPAGIEISFASSRPSQELFPLAEFEATCREVLSSSAFASVLQLGYPGGYPPLRQYLLEEARRMGHAGREHAVAITSGCQQALDLLQRVLVPAGQTVVLEDPVYPGLRNVFALGGARIVGVPVGPHGIEIDRLERTLAQERPRLLIVTPDFQNPTGATLPLASRLAIIRLARQHGVVLVENDIYSGLRYTGDPLPPLGELDETGDVVQLRSFSKIAFPGLRVGWVIGPRPLIDRIAEAKQWSDLHSDQLSQAVLLRFAETGRLETHRRRMCLAGRECLAAVLEGCERDLPRGSTFSRPEGGMSLWVRLPDPLDASDLLPRAWREGVTYVPGRWFAISRRDPATLRLSFAGLAPQQIRDGLRRLSVAFRSEYDTVQARVEPAPAMV